MRTHSGKDDCWDLNGMTIWLEWEALPLWIDLQNKNHRGGHGGACNAQVNKRSWRKELRCRFLASEKKMSQLTFEGRGKVFIESI